MEISARPATGDDLPALEELYRSLRDEMVRLKPVWADADGLAEPVASTFETALADAHTAVYVGELEGVPVGFLLARSEALLPQAEGERIGSIRLIFTRSEARSVGVGEAMMNRFRSDFHASGHRRFDAHVSPGHRAAKSFFEARGFTARRIVMHDRGA
jgi:ribosomal protein S18 acetylase RimI-like enzyme